MSRCYIIWLKPNFSFRLKKKSFLLFQTPENGFQKLFDLIKELEANSNQNGKAIEKLEAKSNQDDDAIKKLKKKVNSGNKVRKRLKNKNRDLKARLDHYVRKML